MVASSSSPLGESRTVCQLSSGGRNWKATGLSSSALAALLEAPANFNVQEEWDLFVTMLAATYKSATQACLEGFSSAVSDEARALLQQTGARSNRKGSLAVHQTLPRDRWGPGPAVRTMAEVRVSKRLAQLYQLQRLLALPGNSRCLQELRALQTKVGMPLTAQGSAQRLAWTQAQIQALTAQRVASEVEAKKHRLRARTGL